MKILIILLSLILTGCERHKDVEKLEYDKKEVKEKNIYNIEKKLLYGEPLINYKEEFKIITDEVKKEYPHFKEGDYVVYYLNADRFGTDFRMVSFNYVINGYIITNSSITVDYEYKKITSIGNSGVSIKEVDADELNNYVLNFKTNKKEIISKKVPDLYKEEVLLNEDYTLKKEGLSDNIKDFDEFFKYDYNTGELKYSIEITKFNLKIPDIEYMDVIDVRLNKK